MHFIIHIDFLCQKRELCRRDVLLGELHTNKVRRVVLTLTFKGGYFHVSHTIIIDVAFEGLSLGDLKPHESVLEQRRNAALAQNEPRKSPQRPVGAWEPLESLLKPHVCKIAQRKEDMSLLDKYKTPREQQNVSLDSPHSPPAAVAESPAAESPVSAESPSAVQWEQHKAEEAQKQNSFSDEGDSVREEVIPQVDEDNKLEMDINKEEGSEE